MHISSIKLVYSSGAEDTVTQLVLPLVGNRFVHLSKVVLKCSDNSEVEFVYNPNISIDIDKVDYALCFNEKYKDLFGHAINKDYYYFVAYSDLHMDLYNCLDIKLYSHEKFVSPEVQDGYLKWTSVENSPSNRKKLVADRIENGVIIPLNNIEPDRNIYNFDYLNIVEVIKKCVLSKKSPYVRVCQYDAYISTDFKFKSALIKRDSSDEKLLRISIVSFDDGAQEFLSTFTAKGDNYRKFKNTLLKTEISGLRYLTL